MASSLQDNVNGAVLHLACILALTSKTTSSYPLALALAHHKMVHHVPI